MTPPFWIATDTSAHRTRGYATFDGHPADLWAAIINRTLRHR